ncbi:hypothetical protein [Ekhidna sp.]
MSTNRFDDLFKEADDAFDGKYKDELNQLYGLSREEIDAITPGTVDMRVYTKLMKTVEEASRQNMELAQLKKRIEDLGTVAIEIAKKVPTLSGMF